MADKSRERFCQQALDVLQIKKSKDIKVFKKWFFGLPHYYEAFKLSDRRTYPSTLNAHHVIISNALKDAKKSFFFKNGKLAPSKSEEITFYELRNMVLRNLDLGRSQEQREQRYYHHLEDADSYLLHVLQYISTLHDWVKGEMKRYKKQKTMGRGRTKGGIIQSKRLFLDEIKNAYDDFIEWRADKFPKTPEGFLAYKKCLLTFACICSQSVGEDIRPTTMKERYNTWYDKKSEKEKFMK